jgi:aspartyl-tRNA(Asn)/glutamyl-tRNA(Gln) amidotransferase subunit A
MTIAKLKEELAGGASAVKITEAYLAAAAKNNPALNAYLEIFNAEALAQAKAVDERLKKGENLPLAGVPLAIKDNILIKGQLSSSASKILGNYRASYSATVIEKLAAAGAIFLGRTNMDEFAMGASTENSAYGQTKNPLDGERVPGGSSGGSAAALAAGLALAALGSDTNGSIRQPASFTGLVGLKPTYGAVSRHGLMALASSFDQIGSFTGSVADAEAIFEVIKGPDQYDSTCFENPNDKGQMPNKLTIGVPRHFFAEHLAADSATAFEATLKKLEAAGYKLKEIELPHAQLAVPAYYVITPAEASSNLARFDGMRYGVRENGADLFGDYAFSRGRGFGAEPRRRIMLGAYALSAGYYDAYYGRAKAVRQLIVQDFEKVFAAGVDLVATPTTPGAAFRLGERAGDPLQMYLADVFTGPASLAGLPAVSLPGGADAQGLPLGFHLVAPRWREDYLFAAGRALEEN